MALYHALFCVYLCALPNFLDPQKVTSLDLKLMSVLVGDSYCFWQAASPSLLYTSNFLVPQCIEVDYTYTAFNQTISMVHQEPPMPYFVKSVYRPQKKNDQKHHKC